MNEHLVGYLLDCLDEGTHRAVDRYLEASAEGRRSLERLRTALAPLEADRGDREPPRDLLIRTLTQIAEHGARELPRAPAMPRAFAGGCPFWRRADFLVAASLVLLVTGLSMLAVFQVR